MSRGGRRVWTLKEPNTNKKYFVPNYKNLLLIAFGVLCGAALTAVSIVSHSWVGIVIGLVMFGCGVGIAILQPTHAVAGPDGIRLYYAFGIFRESAGWADITAVYENAYKDGRRSDREKVFYFVGIKPKYRFMRSEFARSRKMRKLILAFWGKEPVIRTSIEG